MSLLVMWDENFYDNEPNEFDECTLCGNVTKVLIWFRLQTTLIGVCGNCIDMMKRGYDEMLKRRLAARKARVSGDA